jgi:hypothetical protein
MQVLPRQALVRQHNGVASGVTIARAQPRRESLMQVLSRQAVAGQHNVGAFE